MWQKRPIHMAKEVYSYGKKGLFIWQKRPIHMAKEAYSYGKKGLFIWQKRPIHMAKKAYSYGKKGLQTMACLSNMNRPLLSYKQVSFVTYAYLSLGVGKRALSKDLFICQKRPTHM